MILHRCWQRLCEYNRKLLIWRSLADSFRPALDENLAGADRDGLVDRLSLTRRLDLADRTGSADGSEERYRACIAVSAYAAGRESSAVCTISGVRLDLSVCVESADRLT